jgi:hypothetical protein
MRRLKHSDPLLVECRSQVARVLVAVGRPDLVINLAEMPIYIARERKRLWGCYTTFSLATGLGRIVLCCPAKERKTTLLHEYAHALVQWMAVHEEDDHGFRFNYWLKQLETRTE